MNAYLPVVWVLACMSAYLSGSALTLLFHADNDGTQVIFLYRICLCIERSLKQWGIYVCI